MVDLRRRFGTFVRAHRLRCQLTQDALAERAGISIDMVSKIESGSTGASFAVINRLADSLNVDPAELFTSELPNGQLRRAPLVELTARLASLSNHDLMWLQEIIDVVLRPRK